MKFISRLVAPLAVLAACSAGGAWYFRAYQAEVRAEIDAYLDQVQAAERLFLDKLPVYADWANPTREAELRRYLLKEHLALAAGSGLPIVADDDELAGGLRAGRLSKIERTPEDLFYFYALPKQYRVLSPETLRGLRLVTERLQRNLRKRGETVPVKIAVSSALRPISYQRKLRRRNANAASASSHSYGVSFDLFYDDFFVVLPPVRTRHELSRLVLEKLRGRLGYMLGDSLARQFRAVLAETLIELQNEGLLYAILERNQRCYHVSILPAGYGAGSP